MELELTKPQIIAHVEKSVGYTLFDCKWIPGTAKFATLGSNPKGTGVIELFEVAINDVKSIKKIDTDTSLKTGTFGASPIGGKNLACGDFDGNVRIWDLETSKNIYDVKGHDQIINTIDGMGGANSKVGPPEIVTGSRDGSVKIWDVRQKEKPVAIIEPGMGEDRRDCWAVAFGNSFSQVDRIICSGYDNGDLKMFDLREMKIIWEKNLKNGVCSIQFDRKDIKMNKIIVTTLESKFLIFDTRTLHPKLGYSSIAEKAHKSTVWTGRHLPQNRDIFMTTGGSGSLCLWKYTYPECRVKKDSDGVDMGVMGNVELLQNMTLSTQPISSFDWCAEKQGLAVCTGLDQIVRLLIVTKLGNY